MSLSMVMCQIWCVKLQISDSILQKLKIVGVISLISLIKFFLKIVHNLEGNKSVFSSIKEGVINYWKLSKGGFLQSPFKSSQVTLLARNRPWTSLDHPNSNSEYSGAVRTRSEIHPKTVFLSICLGSHDCQKCLVTLSSCISQKVPETEFEHRPKSFPDGAVTLPIRRVQNCPELLSVKGQHVSTASLPDCAIMTFRPLYPPTRNRKMMSLRSFSDAQNPLDCSILPIL